MASPTIRDFQSNHSGTASVSVTVPAHDDGAAPVDRMVAFILCRDQTFSWTNLSGFTIQQDVTHATETLLRAVIATKDVAPGEPASYTFAHDGVGIGMAVVVVCIAGSFALVTDLAADNTLNGLQDSPSITPASVESLLLRVTFAESEGGTVPFIKPPPGFTEVVEKRGLSPRHNIEVSSVVAGITEPTGVTNATSHSSSAETGSFSVYSIGGVVEAQPDTTVYLDARVELGLDVAGGLFTLMVLDARAELGLDLAGVLPLLEARIELGLDLEALLTIIHALEARVELGLDAAAMAHLATVLAARLELGARPRESPLGPGYGLVVEGAGGGASAGFTEIPDVTAGLREGDEFLAYLPAHGVAGMLGLARLIQRRASDESRRQVLEEIQLALLGDESIVPRLAGGDQVRVRPQKTVQHEFRRFQRRTRRRHRFAERRRGS